MVRFSLFVIWAASVMLTLSPMGGTTHAVNTKQMGQSDNAMVVAQSRECVSETYSFDVIALPESPEVPNTEDLEFNEKWVHKDGMDRGVSTMSGIRTGSELSQELGDRPFSLRPNSSIDSVNPSESISWRSASSLIFSFIFVLIIVLVKITVLKKIDPTSSDKKSTIPDIQPERRGVRENKLLLELDAPISQSRRITVYKGFHARVPVAVKFAKMVGTSADASEEPMEAKIMRMLKHPNIVALVVSGSYIPPPRFNPRHNGLQLPYNTLIAMEMCDRGSLHQLTKGMMNVDMVMMCALEIAQAMHYMHSKRIIHGCLHSKHIFLKSSQHDPRGFTCKVGGLGSAVRLSRGAHSVMSSKTSHVSICAPEVLKSGTLGYPSDVYAYAMVLYTMSARQSPFRELRSSQIVCSVLSGERPFVPEFVLPPLADLIKDCWSTCVHKRPSFAVIVETIEKLLAERRPNFRIPDIMEATDKPLPRAGPSEERMTPGTNYACIHLQPSTRMHRSDTSAALDRIPEQATTSTMPNYGRCGSSNDRGSAMKDAKHEAYVRQVDAVIKQSRRSASKEELRRFLDTVALRQ